MLNFVLDVLDSALIATSGRDLWGLSGKLIGAAWGRVYKEL